MLWMPANTLRCDTMPDQHDQTSQARKDLCKHFQVLLLYQNGAKVFAACCPNGMILASLECSQSLRISVIKTE